MSDTPWKDSNEYLDNVPDLDDEDEEWLQWLDETLEEKINEEDPQEFPLDKTLDNL